VKLLREAVSLPPKQRPTAFTLEITPLIALNHVRDLCVITFLRKAARFICLIPQSERPKESTLNESTRDFDFKKPLVRRIKIRLKFIRNKPMLEMLLDRTFNGITLSPS